MKIFKFICLVLICFLISASIAASQPDTKDANNDKLNDFQKETIKLVRDITLQLILITVGVFALMGGFITTGTRELKGGWLIWLAFFLLIWSISFGLLTYGNLIWNLGKNEIDLFGNLRFLALNQWGSFGVGGLVFAIFVALNVGRKSQKEQQKEEKKGGNNDV